MPIHGLEYNENDDVHVMNKVERCCHEISVKFALNEIDRVHYISTSIFDTGSKQKVRSIIVKYKSWELRSAFCKACRINLMNGRKKLGAKKRRYILFKKPRVKDNPSVAFAFLMT